MRTTNPGAGGRTVSTTADVTFSVVRAALTGVRLERGSERA
jgi:hypothetical protein